MHFKKWLKHSLGVRILGSVSSGYSQILVLPLYTGILLVCLMPYIPAASFSASASVYFSM